MEKIGYSLVRLADSAIIATTYALPCRLTVDGVGVVDFDQAGQVMPDAQAPTHKFVERWADVAPSSQHTLATEAEAYDAVAGRVNVTRTWAAAPPPTQQQLVAYANTKQDAILAGGVYVNGVWVSASTAGRVDVTGAVSLAQQEPARVFDWVSSTGIVQLTAAQVIALGAAVGAWVQSTYSVLGSLRAGIAAGTITTYAQIDAASWPAST